MRAPRVQSCDLEDPLACDLGYVQVVHRVRLLGFLLGSVGTLKYDTCYVYVYYIRVCVCVSVLWLRIRMDDGRMQSCRALGAAES